MAIYFPPLFCGIGTSLKAIQNIDVEFDDGETMKVLKGETCFVDDIIAYGFNIKKDNSDKSFRIMNSTMPNYFDIINKVEVNTDLTNFNYAEKDGELIELRKDFEIKDVVKISRGQKFLSFIDRTKNRIFHDLFSIDNKEKVLRMKDVEFEEYFNNKS
jgi:hypothetical protein